MLAQLMQMTQHEVQQSLNHLAKKKDKECSVTNHDTEKATIQSQDNHNSFECPLTVVSPTVIGLNTSFLIQIHLTLQLFFHQG